MNNDFLETYKIPINIVHNVTPVVNTGGVQPANIIDCMALQNTLSPLSLPSPSMNNIERFIPPGKYGTNYVPPPQKRKYIGHLTNGGTPAKVKNATTQDTTDDGKLVIFFGRDDSYPRELNMLIKPLECQLCRIKINSQVSAKDHYESKSHDKHITQWLQTNYIDKGLPVPDIKRFHNAGPKGPEAFHCDLCDIKLTSLSHAKQHYSGRKHRLVAENVSKPSGVGYYDSNGKWVRTGTKLSKVMCNDGRFGIGEQFLHLNTRTPAGTADVNAVRIISDRNEILPAPSRTIKAAIDPSLICQICNISVTSESQMQTHLLGTKHQNKLKAASIDGSINLSTLPICKTDEKNSVLAASLIETNNGDDYSMYRTPSGSYYCQTCNVSLCHVTALQQHLVGKKHQKRAADDKNPGHDVKVEKKIEMQK